MAHELFVEVPEGWLPSRWFWAQAMQRCIQLSRQADPAGRFHGAALPKGWSQMSGGSWSKPRPWPEGDVAESIPMTGWVMFQWPDAEVFALGHELRSDWGISAWSFTIAPERGDCKKLAEQLTVALALAVLAVADRGGQVEDRMAIGEKWNVTGRGRDGHLCLDTLAKRLREQVTP